MTTKQNVLKILNENTSAVSGQLLADKCQVSRTAIWKAVDSLRKDGYDIQGTTNGGYILSQQNDVFSLEVLKNELTKAFPQYASNHVECLKTIDSTVTYAKRILTEAGALRLQDSQLTELGKKYHKSLIVAETQTNGRGRLGRSFVSPSKTGVYLSVIYAPKGGITEPAKITAFAAVAVCRAIKNLFPTSKPKIKWINDIFINGKKICGILTEGVTNFETGTIESAIIGIGINIKENASAFNGESLKNAGSICSSNETQIPSRCQVAAQVCGQLLNLLKEDSSKVVQEYKSLLFLLGQTIQIHPIIDQTESQYSAKAIDIDKNFNLVVELADKTIKTLNSGEVSLRSYQFNQVPL